MPDDEGYSLPGELQVGGYAAGEMDLGEKLCGPLGFSPPEVEFVDDEPEFVAPGINTVSARVVYRVPSNG